MNPSPFEILSPENRWAPSQAQMDAFNNQYEKLLPPLVHKIRVAVEKWRNDDYNGATNTTKALLNYWFNEKHINEKGDEFQFYFAQREAIESVIYLYEIAKAKDKYELLKFDGSGRISANMFIEDWTRYVIKMATGTGKTKVLGLVLVWAFFNKKYEENSGLSSNFLVITPNIIVLNRVRKDFDGLKYFFEDPFIPPNGYENKNWNNDFQLTLHIQDDLKPITESGNIFLTNVHRIFISDEKEPTLEETFLGKKPKSDADTSRGLDLGKVLRSNKIKDLIVLNDEAHHIHDESLAWFQSIRDISNKLKLVTGNHIPLQCDVTATPKHNDGSIFVQTICDYPLVEAINQKVVKAPVLPDQESRNKLEEKPSSDVIEKYKDYIDLGVTEWEKYYNECKNKKTPLLFIMAMNTKEADQIADYLERTYPILKNAVLTIHTNNKGEIKETSTTKKAKDELDRLRKAADDVDSDFSPYKAICSVLMLREGWDVKNVTTIVGLRPFKADSKILPEQTIGRGLRKMFSLDSPETLSVIGTDAFIDFVESLKTEGVEFQYSPMGKEQRGLKPIIIEIDFDNKNKNLTELDIPIPNLTPIFFRDFKNLNLINLNDFQFSKLNIKEFNLKEVRKIKFNDIDGKFSHETDFSNNITYYKNIIAFFTQSIISKTNLVSGFDILYPKIELFIKKYLFGKDVNIEEPQIIKNYSEPIAQDIIFKSFVKAINELTVSKNDNVEIKEFISLLDTKPKIVENQDLIIPKKSVFNKIVADNNFELEFAAFCENKFSDVISFAKNSMGSGGVNFKIEYQAENGNIREYYPDFFVKTSAQDIFIVETKGREDLDDINKINRLKKWCDDVNKIQNDFIYSPIYIKQEDWEDKKSTLKSFNDVKIIFRVN